MRWKGRGQSTRIEDRRGRRAVVRGGAGLGAGAVLVPTVFTLLTDTFSG
ncbi:MAG: hypothetical protein R3325_13595 [Thermoanaerobaculia bacterium]|nr:hypothetical protein [Thermoanaerobaculia bacterium]